MKLEGTIDMMTSKDYRERFKAEYYQLKERYEKLKSFNNKIEAAVMTRHSLKAVDEPVHDCPSELLRQQQRAMGEYLHILEVRAVIENIDLRECGTGESI